MANISPTKMEEIESVVLENDIFPMDTKDIEEEDDMASLVNHISNLEKT